MKIFFFLYLVGISLLGAFCNYLIQIDKDKKKFNFKHLFRELVKGFFICIMIYFICISQGVKISNDLYIISGFSGFFSNQITDFLFKLDIKKYLNKFIKNKV